MGGLRVAIADLRCQMSGREGVEVTRCGTQHWRLPIIEWNYAAGGANSIDSVAPDGACGGFAICDRGFESGREAPL
jgi:hypothetical protein